MFSSERKRHPYCCAVTARVDIKPTADQLHSFPHARNADTNVDAGFLFLFLCNGRESSA